MATPYNPRTLELTLRERTRGTVYRLPVFQDARLHLPSPSESRRLDLSASLPQEVAPGQYELFVNVPDPSPSIAARPEYSIRLANVDMWDAATGFNKLATEVTIAP
jgi:hypothetical protein